MPHVSSLPPTHAPGPGLAALPTRVSWLHDAYEHVQGERSVPTRRSSGTDGPDRGLCSARPRRLFFQQNRRPHHITFRLTLCVNPERPPTAGTISHGDVTAVT